MKESNKFNTKEIDFNYIKSLSNDELFKVSKDIKNQIIKACSEFGGHLSSNLGTTNLTISLCRVFDFNKDKIIFDIGHSTYAYKILTGRKLDNLRESNGVAGFSRVKESQYDFYDGGHSSTSISAALGFAKARDLNKEKYDVIAVIGDGSIANGLPFEAINNLSTLNTKVIIVLNDNEMSIAPTQGGLHKILKGLNDSEFANNIFGENKLQYLGPVDGDNFEEMEKVFLNAKNIKNSSLIHVRTKKGSGFKYAEEDKTGKFHFTQPFDIETGNQKIIFPQTKKSFSKYFSSLLDKELEENKKCVAICPSTTVGAELIDVFSKHKDRTFDVGICEEHSLIFASSFAMNDFKTYVLIYSTFLQRAYDEIIHDITRLNTKVTLLIDRCGLIGRDGETHQGIYDDGFLYSIPNLCVAMPKDEFDAKNLFEFQKTYNNPFAIRYASFYMDNSFYKNDEDDKIHDFNWKILKQGNNNLCVVTFGPHILDLYDRLINDDVTIINALFIKGYDLNSIKMLLNYKKIYIYDPYGVESGFASNVLLTLNKLSYKGEVIIKAIPLEFVNSGSILEQEIREKVDVESAYQEIKGIINEGR